MNVDSTERTETLQQVVLAHERCDPKSGYARYGYQIFRGDGSSFQDLRFHFENYLKNALIAQGASIGNEFSLETYHRVHEADPMAHHAFIKVIRRVIPESCISPNHPFLRHVKDVASELFKCRAEIFNSTIEFRVVRPHSLDNNKLHRDHWFPYFKPLSNIYVPLAGSYVDSAMKVVPRSHLWSDEDVVPTFPYEGGKSMNEEGIAFSTPNIKTCAKEIIEHRPDVAPGDFMLFSPLCVHGGGDNLGEETRFSLEVRLQLD